MIPKIIHYCWFGRNPKPKLAKKCFKSWKKYCPDYKIIEWNEDNFDLSAAPLYVRQAYECKKWAFVTDWVRLKVVHDSGGIYLDTDVEVLRNLDGLLKDDAFFGFEDGIHIATGLGFGAVKGNTLLKELMDDYNDIPFILESGELDTVACPVRNTLVFINNGLIQNNTLQTLSDGIKIYPKEYFCPKSYETMLIEKTANTHTIHHFNASWHSKEQRKYHNKHISYQRKERLKHLPNRILIRVLGDERYSRLKKKLKH